MKKRLIIIVSIILSIIVFAIVFSILNNKSNEEKEKRIYVEYVKKTSLIEKSSKEIPFDIEVKFDKITSNEVRYQVILDNPKETIEDISAISIHNKATDDVFPSIGIFDDRLGLIPNEKPSGIILVGYIPYDKSLKKFHCEIKTMIKYKIGDKEYTRYNVTKK